MDWLVCLCKVPKEAVVQVKILKWASVPAKDEQIQIVGAFHSKENAELLASAASLSNEWGTMLFLTDETMYNYLPPPDGR